MRTTLVFVAIACVCLLGVSWSADVTVGTGGTYPTVQAGINAAGAGGTVTILDSQTYVEDVTIKAAQAGVTVQAAAGQRPTIRAANTRSDSLYSGAPLVIPPPDRFGLSVQASCTLIGLDIENLSQTANHSNSFNADFTACAMVVHAPNVVARNCRFRAPTSFSTSPSGDLVAVLVIAFGSTPASLTLENCEIVGSEYGLINETFGRYIPSYTTSTVNASNCLFTSSTSTNVLIDAGVTNLTTCTLANSQGDGIECRGDVTTLVGCNIVNNASVGLHLNYSDDFALLHHFARVSATNCLIARNRGGGQDGDIRLADGRLTLDHCIIGEPQNTCAIFLDDNIDNPPEVPSPCVLNMDFCDVYAPGHDCFSWDMDVNEHPITITIKNSILIGANGLVNTNPGAHPMSVSYSSLFVTGVATQGVTTSNNVTIDPMYVNPGLTRSGFKYLANNLNVGEGGAEIGSQGRYRGTPLDVRRWNLYD